MFATNPFLIQFAVAQSGVDAANALVADPDFPQALEASQVFLTVLDEVDRFQANLFRPSVKRLQQAQGRVPACQALASIAGFLSVSFDHNAWEKLKATPAWNRQFSQWVSRPERAAVVRSKTT